MRTLRDYQSAAVRAVLDTWGRDIHRTAVSLPTGTGKSTVIAAVADEAYRRGLRVVLMAHRGELLDQMADTVRDVNPDIPVGIVRAEQDEPDAPVVVASLQTLANPKRLAAIGPRSVILWDEVHHAGATGWQAVMTQLMDSTAPAFFCGFTATLRREDGKALRDVIDTVAYEKSLRWAIDEGYLVRPRGLTVKIPDLDLNSVKVSGGDYQNAALAEMMEAETEQIVTAIITHCREYRPIVFAASMEAAHDIAQRLTAQEILPATAVTGETPYAERQRIYAQYRHGDIAALVTVQVLTEGADFPGCDAVVIARPTRSQNLYSQMVGRALRPCDGKDHALVVDLVGTARVLSLVTVTSLDAGATVTSVTPDGTELPPEDEEEVSLPTPRTTRRLGPLDMTGIDLLDSGTSALWLATPGKVPFIQSPGTDWAVFLWGRSDAYRTGWITVKGAVKGGWIDEKAWPLSVAQQAAEDYLLEHGCEVPRATASWRRSQPPSDAQFRFAASLGIVDADRMTKARVSDEISSVLVGKRLDR